MSFLRNSRSARFPLLCCLLFFASWNTAHALYTPPAGNPFITDPAETVTTLNVSSGSISDAQTQLNNARTANPNAVIVLNLTGTYTVTTQPLTLPSKTCLVLQSHAVIQASSATTASALIQVTSQSFVSVAGGTLNGNGKTLTGILVTTCDRVEIDDVSIQDCGQDGIRLTGHGNTTFDNEMTVTRCTIFGCDGNGINVSSATQFVAVDNNCFDNGAAGLLIGSAHSSVANNTCTANATGISVTGTPNNAITGNEIDHNGTGIALGSGSASNWCTSNSIKSNTTVGIAAGGSADVIFDNIFSGNASNLSATGTNNHIVARKGALSASGQDYFYPPLIDDPHSVTTIVNGLGRTDVTIGSTTMSSVQSQYDSARSAHPNNVIVLHLTGASYTGDATLNLSSNTCVLLSGTITLASGVTGFKTTGAGANHISVSGGTVDGQNSTGRNALSFSACQMVQIDGMTLNNFGSDASAISGSDTIHFTAGTGAGAPYLVSRCSIDGSAGRAIWSQIALQAVYTNNTCTNTRSGLDFDSHTHNGLATFNTFGNNRYGLFIEQSAQFCQGIGNNCSPGNGRGVNVINNAEDVAVQYNSVICNTANGNGTGLRTAAVGNTSTGALSTTVHNFLFGNQCFNNTGDGIEGDAAGVAAAQNLFSQNNLGGNGTPMATSGSEVFFNPTTPPNIPPTFSIVASAGANGAISPTGTVVVDQAANQTFTVTPNSGYAVASVTVDGTNVGAVASYTFTNVQANHVISATFAPVVVTYTITASAGSGGTIAPSGAVTVNQGTNQTFTIAANSGFTIASVTVDGTNVGAVASYTFSNVQANHTISAAFATGTSTEINDTDAGIVYTGSWAYSSNRNHGDFGNDVHDTRANGDSVSYTFTGTGISYVTETNSDEGNVSFYIDNVFKQTVSCVSATRVAQVTVFTASGLAPGSHTLKAVKVDGTYLLLDALIVSTASNPVATPTFTPSGGSYTSAQSVTIATATTGATIRYTLDGSAPSQTHGTVYSGAVTIGSNRTLQAIAYKSGMNDSAVASATYAISATITVAAGFYNQPLSVAQTGTFTVTFDASASLSPSNSLVGLSQGSAAAYTDIAAAVRFNPTGDIDARNGSAFAAASTIPYSANATYHFRMVINVAAHTYSAYVTPPGGSELTIGSNYAFRTEQAGVTQLDTWNADVNTAPGGTMTVSNVVVP